MNRYRKKRHVPVGTGQMGAAIDLGWCIVRPLDEAGVLKVRNVAKDRRGSLEEACAAGLTVWQHKALTDERRAELRYAVNWTMMPVGAPRVGTVVLRSDATGANERK